MPRLIAPGLDINCEGIVFDKDGTLVDQRQVMLALGRERLRAMREIGGSGAAAFWQEIVGFWGGTEQVDPRGPLASAPAREEVILAAGAIYRAGRSWIEAAALAAHAYALADERLEPPYGAVLLNDVEQALNDLHRAGFRVAIATTDRRQRSLRMMQALGLAPILDTLVAVEDVKMGKPAPDMLLEVCRRLQLQPRQLAVIGDTASDMRMGRAAGAAACIGVRTGLNQGDGLAGLADIILDSAAQLRAG
jgi:phosphoglycolate phosphatase